MAIMSRPNSVAKRESGLKPVHPLPRRTPAEEPSLFHESLKNLSLAVDNENSVENSREFPLNGQPIALTRMSGVSVRERTRLSVPASSAQPSAREDGAEPETGKKRKTKAMVARATATAMAMEKVVSERRNPETGTVRETKQQRRDRVVMEHLPLVKAIAVRVHESLPVHVELDDLVHAGILGLFDAATKYNPDKKVVFSAYAKHRIKGAILDSLRQLDWASRDLRRRHKQVEQVTRDLCAALQRQPTEEELASKMGVDVARWRQMALDLRNVGLISASTRAPEQEDLPAPDFPSTPETQPDTMCAREQLREKLDLAMSALPERYKKVVTLYYTAEMTMKEIGGIMGINESRVSQIHKSALEKMATALQSAGINSAQAF
jgi:RNA polymerase sigma factor for flagellar operon FliA